MPGRVPLPGFFISNILVWLLMVVILVVVPDTLERWATLEVARVIGWAVGYGVWVILIEQRWRERVPPFARFVLQLLIWVSAALLAIWISDQARIP